MSKCIAVAQPSPFGTSSSRLDVPSSLRRCLDFTFNYSIYLPVRAMRLAFSAHRALYLTLIKALSPVR